MISLLLPVYNFEESINEKIFEVKSFLDQLGKKYEIIIINDGSKDKTQKKLNNYSEDKNIKIISLFTNQGKGAAIKEGVIQSNGDYIIFTDIDLPYDLNLITKIIEKIDQGSEVVLGSRIFSQTQYLAKSNTKRRIMSYLFSLLANLVLQKPITDTQCGFKGFQKKAGKHLFQNLSIKGFAFDVEIIDLAQQLGYKISIIPVTLITNGKTTIKPSHVIKMFLDVLKLLFKNKLKIFNVK